MLRKTLLLLAAATAPSLALTAAEYVAESLVFTAVREYAAGSNLIDESVTSDSDTNGISLGTFIAELEAAYDAGLGGVIDFERFGSYGPLKAVDKSLVTAYAYERFKAEGRTQRWTFYRDEVLDDPAIGELDDPYTTGIFGVLDGSDEPLVYDLTDPGNAIFVEAPVPGYTFTDPPGDDEILATEVTEPGTGASGFYLIDPERTTFVKDRYDRFSTFDEVDSFGLGLTPVNPDGPQLAATLVGRFGDGGAGTVAFYRGPAHIEEDALANRDAPGPRSDSPINDAFFFGTWQGPANGDAIPLSGEFMLSGGAAGTATAKDFLFDPRDNISAIGFTLCNLQSFQYFQSGTLDNLDNIIVDAWFTDGSKTEFRGTTFQRDAGTLDQFFGIRAPGAESIARLQVRVVGRNFRTFTNIDDIAFITKPAAPFIRKGAEADGLVGREFCHHIEIARAATSVTIPDLPAGLSFDASTGLVSGTPQASGTFASDVIMTNASGSRTEQIAFTFSAADAGTPAPTITGVNDIRAKVGRPFSYEADVSQAVLESFVIVHRLTEDGPPERVYLDQLGLSLQFAAISGIVPSLDLIGDYTVDLHVRTAGGCAVKSFSLGVIRPAIEPDFNGDGATDWITFDESSGTLSAALSTSFVDADGRADFPPSGPATTTLLVGLPSDTQRKLVDLDADGFTDIVTFEPGTSRQGVHFADGLIFESGYAGFAPEGDWEMPAVDTGRFILRQISTGEFFFYSVPDRFTFGSVPVATRWLSEPGPAEIVAWEDFDGDFQKEALLSYGGGIYAFAEFAEEPGEPFQMESGFELAATGDTNDDGRADIIWASAAEGFFAVWQMTTAAVPAGLRQDNSPDSIDDASAGIIRIFRDPAVFEPSIVADLSGDGASDIVMAESGTGHREILFKPTAAGLQVDLMEDGITPRPKQLRRDEDGTPALQRFVDKLLLENFPVPGELPLALEPDEALINYQIYAQQTDSAGNPLWSISGFHARPVADTSQPLAGRDVFFDGMHGPGEALSSYTIFGRGGDDELGRPAWGGGRFPRPKLVDKPQPDPGTVDYVWEPVGPEEPGVDYDARGRRGFLKERGLYGLPRLDEFGQPVFELWRNSLGQTVENVPDSQPYELDYIRPEPDVRTVDSAASIEWVGIADFDGDGIAEIIEKDTVLGTYNILYPNEVGLSRLTLWLREQFGDENLPIADLGGDPDFDGCSTLIEYALGVDDLYRERPQSARLEAALDGEMRIRFPWRILDETLRVEVEYLDAEGSWSVAETFLAGFEWQSEDTAEVLLRTGVQEDSGPVLMRLQIRTE